MDGVVFLFHRIYLGIDTVIRTRDGEHDWIDVTGAIKPSMLLPRS